MSRLDPGWTVVVPVVPRSRRPGGLLLIGEMRGLGDAGGRQPRVPIKQSKWSRIFPLTGRWSPL